MSREDRRRRAQELCYDPDEDYIHTDLFLGDMDVAVRAVKVKIVTTRKLHRCASPIGGNHDILKGTRARYESALINDCNDEFWGQYWTCLPCIDAWLDEIGE